MIYILFCITPTYISMNRQRNSLCNESWLPIYTPHAFYKSINILDDILFFFFFPFMEICYKIQHINSQSSSDGSSNRFWFRTTYSSAWFYKPQLYFSSQWCWRKIFFSVRPLTKAQGKVMLKNETNLPYHEREIQQCYSLKSSLIWEQTEIMSLRWQNFGFTYFLITVEDLVTTVLIM